MTDKEASQKVKKRYNRIAPIFDWMEFLMEKKACVWRRQLWRQVSSGRVLEVGIGTGKNMAYYPESIEICGIDLSDKMLAQASRRAKDQDILIDLMEMDAESLSFKDSSFDVVVGTFVFCSVPDPIKGLKELARVAKPSGKIILLEHVRLDRWGWLMDLVNPLIRAMVGANINRNTVENVKQAGLKIESVENMVGNGLIKLIIASPDPSRGNRV